MFLLEKAVCCQGNDSSFPENEKTILPYFFILANLPEDNIFRNCSSKSGCISCHSRAADYFFLDIKKLKLN